MTEPTIIPGGVAVDDRGSVRFVNDFDFKDVKRFYHVENHRCGFIRAWHGHLKESKYVYVVRGSIQLKLRKLYCGVLDPDINKSDDYQFVLSSQSPKVLYIPAGYANGFKTLEEDTSVLFFSTITMDEAAGDDYRFPTNKQEWEEDFR